MAIAISNPNPIFKEMGVKRYCLFCNNRLKSNLDLGYVNDITWSCPIDKRPGSSTLEGHYNVKYIWNEDRQIFTTDINTECINIANYYIVNYHRTNKSVVSTVTKTKSNFLRQGIFRRIGDDTQNVKSDFSLDIQKAFTSNTLIKIKTGMSLEDYKNKIDKLINFL